MAVKLVLHPAGGVPFQDKLFGLNAEITRRGFFSGLSAEMLNNRKLYAGTDLPAGWECCHAEYITDHPEKSLCGSRFVILHNGEMVQKSEVISLRSGRTYEARLWVKAYGQDVQVTFGVEGSTKTFSVPEDNNQYTELSFPFDGYDADNGSFIIRADGDLAVFEMSLMPTDHFYGMRRDVIEHLKIITPTSIRFPGGCAADHFDWKESLKAPELRTPADGSSKWFLFRDSYDQDCLDIGLNEFMMLCRELNTEPEYTVSLLLSDGEDARRLVEYCNGSPDTEYGARRQALGFDAFHINLWYIGNEAYFFGGEKYAPSGAASAECTNELVNAMRQADSSISAVLGLTWAEPFKPWNRDFMAHIDCQYEYISFHDYIGILPDPTQGHNGLATCEMLENNFRDGESIGLHFYKDDLFAGQFDTVKICADEWNYSWGYDSSNALFFSNALQFHFLAKSYEKYHIVRAEFFMPVNEGMITVKGADSKLESTGELFRLMKPHMGGMVIGCTADNDALDILCTEHNDGRLYLSIVNRFTDPCAIDTDGYEILSCTEIRTGEYSFQCNDYTVHPLAEPVISGHSVLFLALRRK